MVFPARRTVPADTTMPPPSVASFFGCGRVGSSKTWIGWRGDECRPQAASCPRNPRRSSTAPAVSPGVSTSMNADSRWPNAVCTRQAQATTSIGCSTMRAPSKVPSILRVSATIFSSSLPM